MQVTQLQNQNWRRFIATIFVVLHSLQFTNSLPVELTRHCWHWWWNQIFYSSSSLKLMSHNFLYKVALHPYPGTGEYFIYVSPSYLSRCIFMSFSRKQLVIQLNDVFYFTLIYVAFVQYYLIGFVWPHLDFYTIIKY